MSCPSPFFSIFLHDFSTDFFHQTYILMYNRCQNQVSLVPDRLWIIQSVPIAVDELGKVVFHIITAIYCADFLNKNNRNFQF